MNHLTTADAGHTMTPSDYQATAGVLQADVAALPNVTPAELLLLCGVIAERAHRMSLSPITSCVARRLVSEWVRLARSRGFADERRLRGAFRVGCTTPRGLMLASQVVSHFTTEELPVLIERARRFDAFMTRPSMATGTAVRNSPRQPPARQAGHVSEAR